MALIDSRSEFYPDRYPCPACSRFMTIADDDVDYSEVGESVVEVTPMEFFAAMSGLGLPDERECSEEVVTRVLREQPIRRVVGSSVEGSRYCIHHLELWDGTRLYMAASPDGAIVYRIVRPTRYTERAAHA